MKKAGRILLLIIVGVIIIATFKFLWDTSRPEAPNYEIISPTWGNVYNTTTVTGNIEPRNETAVKPEISGTISTILKEVGQYVNKGDIIATVQKIPDAGEISAAEYRLQVANINLDQVAKEFDRQKYLYESEVLSKNDYEIIEARYYKAIEEKENAKDALEIAKTGTSRKSNTVNNTLVRSSSSGTILDIPVKKGDRVIHTNPFNEGTTVAVVANMNDLIFRGSIDESDIGKIWEGMPVSISVGAMPNETIDAVLEYIAPKGVKESGSVLYEIKAAIKVPKIPIRANYSANAEIVIDQVENIIKIPESSVEFNKNGSTYVYVLKSDNGKNQTFTKKAVEIGLYDGDYIEVKSGISLDDKIRGRKVEN